VREHFLAISDISRIPSTVVQRHVDFPLFQRLALPIQVGTARFPGIKIQHTRMIRLNFATMYARGRPMIWLPRDGHHYTYRLTDKGVKVALLLFLFHKRLCGPLAK
jgi:hypothetical protein